MGNGLMFPEKIQFDSEKYQTNSYNRVLDCMFQNTRELIEQKPEDRGDLSLSSGFVPGAGVEPALQKGTGV